MKPTGPLAALRARSERASVTGPFDPLATLFDKQRDFVTAPGRYKTLCGPRRMGKTEVACAMLFGEAKRRRCTNVYIAPMLTDAKDIIWDRLLDWNRDYKLGFQPNAADLELRGSNDSKINLRGAKDEGQAERIRGQGVTGVAIVDEAQGYGPAMRPLIISALLPALTAKGANGSCVVMGTPSRLAIGMWHDLAHDTSGTWQHGSWGWWDNPHLVDMEMVVREAARACGNGDETIGRASAEFRREWMGEWITDFSALVFQFDPLKNVYDELPGPLEEMECVLAYDLGHSPDPTTLVVLGWWPKLSRALYLVDEHAETGLNVDTVEAKIRAWIDRYHPLWVVGDEGALGKMIAATLRSRGIICEPAEKADKLGRIDVLNTDLASGLIKVRKGSRAYEEFSTVMWDPRKKEEGKLAVSDETPNDVVDAIQYGHTKCWHRWHQPPPPELTGYEAQQARLRAEIAEITEQRERPAFERGEEDPHELYR